MLVKLLRRRYEKPGKVCPSYNTLKNTDIISQENSRVVGTRVCTLSPEIFRGKAVMGLNLSLELDVCEPHKTGLVLGP